MLRTLRRLAQRAYAYLRGQYAYRTARLKRRSEIQARLHLAEKQMRMHEGLNLEQWRQEQQGESWLHSRYRDRDRWKPDGEINFQKLRDEYLNRR